MFLETSQISQEIPPLESLFNNAADLQIFFGEHMQASASETFS